MVVLKKKKTNITKKKIYVNPKEDNFCMISGCLYVDPVKTEHGQTFERIKLIKWLKTTNTCPATRQIIHEDKLITDTELKKKIHRLVKFRLVRSSFIKDWKEIQEEYTIDEKFTTAINSVDIWTIYELSKKNHVDSLVELANYFYDGQNSDMRNQATGFLFWDPDEKCKNKKKEIRKELRSKEICSPYIYFLVHALKYGDPRAQYMMAYEYEFREHIINRNTQKILKLPPLMCSSCRYDYEKGISLYLKASECYSSPISIIAMGHMATFYSREIGYDTDFYRYRDEEVDDVMNYRDAEYYALKYDEACQDRDAKEHENFKNYFIKILENEVHLHGNRFAKFKLSQIYLAKSINIDAAFTLLVQVARGEPDSKRLQIINYTQVEKSRYHAIAGKARRLLRQLKRQIRVIAQKALEPISDERNWRAY